MSASVLFAFVSAILFLTGEGLCKGEHPSDFGFQTSRIEMVRRPSVFIGLSHKGLSDPFPLVFFDGKLDGERADVLSLAMLPASGGDGAANNDAPYNGVRDEVVPDSINPEWIWWLKFLFGVAIGSVLGPLVLMRWMPKNDHSWMAKQAWEHCGYANVSDQPTARREP